MIDIYCEDKICPICGSKMKHLRDDSIRCINKCYIWKPQTSYSGIIAIFGELYTIMIVSSKYCSNKTRDSIVQKIEYWRENDRYLAHILGG